MSCFHNKITIVYGHYGAGKTNFALNLALKAGKECGGAVLVDLDIVNPFFRSSDHTELLTNNGVRVIAPQFAGSNLDVPSIPAEVFSVFGAREKRVIIDVGGDDVGARVLGRFKKQLADEKELSVIYLINKYRNLTQTPKETAQLLHEIEASSGVMATCIVNNSHLQGYTDADTVISSLPFAEETAEILNLPLAATAVNKEIAEGLKGKAENIFPLEILVKPPF